MGKKKWYVVIVGRAVGVFATWLEVAPLVTGVSGAQHQSFPTEEEALQAFRDEFSKGRVKIVNAETVTSPSLSGSTPSARCTPHRSHSHRAVSAPQTPVGGGSSVSRSNSEWFCADGEERHRRRMPAESPRYSSPRYPPSAEHAASVRTPSGLEYYPSSNKSLTPLRSPVKLSFGDTDFNMTRSPRHSRVNTPIQSSWGHNSLPVICDDCVDKCIHCNRKVGSDLAGRSLSSLFTQMHVSHHTTYGERLDPRSPMAKTGYLPASTGSISIGRPSPSRNVESGSMLFRGV